MALEHAAGRSNIRPFGRDSLGPYLAGYEGRQIAGARVASAR